jgi:flagellar basal body rod protein FlgG
MSYGIWLSAGGMQVNEYRQSVIANNIANADTVGFKRDFPIVRERPVESDVAAGGSALTADWLSHMTGGVWSRPTYTSFAQGELEQTGRSLDTALAGEGFFTVDVDGKKLYTRDGRFTINSDHELVLTAGDGTARVLDETGKPIVVEQSRLPLTIEEDGAVLQGKNTVARLGIVDFADESLLRKTGASLVEDLGSQATIPAKSLVKSGSVERSTVDPIESLTGMIEVTRAYEMNARMISIQDAATGEAVSRVGRIG